MNSINLNVPNVSCSICSGKIKDKLSSMDGIEYVAIDMKKQIVNVEYQSDTLTQNDISNTISSMGYEIIPNHFD